MASVTTSGSEAFEARFMTGFTRGHSWEWERRWRYPSGFFRLTLRGHYGIGLRIPIKISGTLSPTRVAVKDSRDQVVPVRATLSATTVDGDAAFFRDAGLSDTYGPKEAVCEAGFGWGFKFRALWTDIKHVKVHDIADFNLGQNFKPPFGADPDATFRLAIPPELTGSSFDWAAVSGFAQAGLRFDGKGSIGFDCQPFQGDRPLPLQHLRFTSASPRALDLLLPAMAVPGGQGRASEPYGFTLARPSYTLDLRVTPEIRARITVGHGWVSHTFDTGWKSLNAFAVSLGRLTLGRHEGTRREFRFAGGTKGFERIAATPDGRLEVTRATLRSFESNKLVRAGVGPQELLTASSTRAAGWETFDLVRIGQGLVALRSVQSGKFVRIGVRDGANERLAAISPRADVLETFKLIDAGEGWVALQALHTGKFVRAGDGPESFLTPVSTRIGAWEKFRIERLDGGR